MANLSIAVMSAVWNLNSWRRIRQSQRTGHSHFPNRTNVPRKPRLRLLRNLRRRASGTKCYDGTPQAENDRNTLPVLRRRGQFQSDDWAGRPGASLLVRSLRTSEHADQSTLSVHLREVHRVKQSCPQIYKTLCTQTPRLSTVSLRQLQAQPTAHNSQRTMNAEYRHCWLLT
jgi:hypothetical protein